MQINYIFKLSNRYNFSEAEKNWSGALILLASYVFVAVYTHVQILYVYYYALLSHLIVEIDQKMDG